MLEARQASDACLYYLLRAQHCRMQWWHKLMNWFGLQPHGILPSANMVKECAEEASIPEHLARQAVPAGQVLCTPFWVSQKRTVEWADVLVVACM